jgi:hypothetical protein
MNEPVNSRPVLHKLCRRLHLYRLSQLWRLWPGWPLDVGYHGLILCVVAQSLVNVNLLGRVVKVDRGSEIKYIYTIISQSTLNQLGLIEQSFCVRSPMS